MYMQAPDQPTKRSMRFSQDPARWQSHMESEHLYEYREGGVVGEQRRMTGLQARSLNTAFRVAYFQEVSNAHPNKPDTQLKSWMKL